METSFSDMSLFNRCRRKWDLTSVNRQRLTHAAMDKDYFVIGSIVHALLEAQADDPGGYAHADRGEWIDPIFDEIMENYESLVGSPMSPNERVVYWDENYALGDALVENYIDHWGQDTLKKQGLHYVHKEFTFKMPLPNVNNGPHYVRGTIDGLARDNAGRLWVVEHKTFSRRPSPAVVSFNEQIRVYAWAVKQLTGEYPAGSLYDGLSKKLPTVPRLLKDGSLSKAKIDTDVKTYAREIARHNLVAADYAEILNDIKERNDAESPFFYRQSVPISPVAVEETVSTMSTIVNEMIRDDVPLWPHRPFNGCGDCAVKAICDAMTLGEDVDMVKQDYTEARPYGSFAKEHIEKLELRA